MKGVSRKGVSPQRLKTILERQEPPRFGADYIPSTFATPQEAPSISRPAILQSRKLNREIHLLSNPELHATLLALYHPHLFDLHEQKMLSRWPYLHPMTGMPGVDASSLKPVRGTVEVAERLGYLDLHPIIYLPDEESPRGRARVPFPYLGDLLLFMRPPGARPYCVNWPIKKTRGDFTRPGPGKKRPDSPEARRSANARFEIEVAYHSDADIRTQPIAGEDIDWDVSANLCQIYPFVCKKIDVELDRQTEIVESFKTGLIAGIPPLEVMLSLVMRCLCTRYEARVILFQAIWNRQLRVDLFKPVLVDYPLQPEVEDVLVHYAKWFEQ